MKRHIAFTVMLVVILVLSAVTQVSAAVVSQYGIKAGYQGLNGFKAGVFTAINLGNNFHFQPELYYSQRKYQFTAYYDLTLSTTILPVGETTARDVMRTIEVPMLLTYTVPLRGVFKPVVFAGGYVAFNLEEQRYKYIDYAGGSGYMEPDRSYEDIDYGVVLGVGFQSGKKVKLIMDVRVNLGLVEVQKVAPLYFIAMPGAAECGFGGDGFYFYDGKKNRSVSVMLGVSF